MTYTTVQQARSAIEAAAPSLTHITDPSPTELQVTYLWTAAGHDIAEYYSHDDGSFAGGNVGLPGGTQLPFTDLVAFVAALWIAGAR